MSGFEVFLTCPHQLTPIYNITVALEALSPSLEVLVVRMPQIHSFFRVLDNLPLPWT